MKKVLTTSIVFIIFIISALLFAPTLLSLFGFDKKLKEYIVDKLSSSKETTFIIDKISFGFGKIELEDIKFISHSSDFSVTINSIDFDYSFFKLLINADDPHKAIDKIHLINPILTLKKLEKRNTVTDPEQNISDVNVLEALNQFDNIDKIYLENGSIVLEEHADNELILAQRLNGWVDSHDFSAISIKARGDISNSFSVGFNLDCMIDLIGKSFLATIELKDVDLKNAKYINGNSDVKIEDGILDSRLYVSNTSFKMDSLKVNGYLSLSDYSMKYLDSNINDLKIKALIVNNELKIDKGEGLLDQSNFTISGKIDNIFKPEFLGSLSCKELDIKSISKYLNTKIFDQNKIEFESDITLTANSYKFNVQMLSSNLFIGSNSVENFKSSLTIENGILNIDSIIFTSYDFNFQSKGFIDFQSGEYKGQISGYRDFEEHLFFDKLTGSTQNVITKVQGNITDQTLNGKWQYNVQNQADTLFLMDGLINLDNEKFNFAMNRNSHYDCFFSLQIIDIFDNPVINYGYIENIPIYLFTSRGWVSDIFNKYQFEGILVGSLNDFNAKISINDKSHNLQEYSLTCRVTNLLKTNKQIRGNLSLDKFNGEYSFELGDNDLKGYFVSGETCKGNFDINLLRDEHLNSTIELNKFNINQFYPDSNLAGYGELSGHINIQGMLDDPIVYANLCGDKFIFNDVGYYKFELVSTCNKNYANIDSLQMSLNNTPILNGNLAIDIQNKQIDAIAYGEKVGADYIFKTFFDRRDLVKGIGDYKININGPLQSPKISTEIVINQGEFDNIPFDVFELQVSDKLAEGKNFLEYKNHLINIGKFVLIKGGLYHLEGEGNLPLYKHGEIDFDLKFEGDILSMIPIWDDFFIDGASFATIQLKVGGTPSSPKIFKGFAQIEKGELWLKSVVDHIENIEGTIALKEGTNEVNILGISAEVNGKSLVINTVRDVTTSDGQQLKSWFFKDLDLDFGILQMETPKGGLELQITGFMLDGEKGLVSLSGKTENEKFYLSGPVRMPHAWGNVEFSDSRFTFPFITENTGKPTKAVEFLRNMFWDVNVFAGKDLHYVRDIPAILGKVDTELSIDPMSQGLSFEGVIDKNSFKPAGQLTSSRGRVEYLDLNFRIENFGITFDSNNQEPEVYGRAWTAVRDSVGAIPRTIYLELYTVNKETGLEEKRARWETFRFRLVPADKVVGETQEEILSYLGYSVQNIENKAKQVGGAVTENYIIRPLLRPLERSLEKYLGVDLVRFNSSIAKNLFITSLGQKNKNNGLINRNINSSSYSPYLFLFESSELTVGKYLTQDLYFTYTGQLVATSNEDQNDFSFNHSFGIEYRFFKNLLLEFEYDREVLDYYQFYSSKSYQEDLKIRLRHSFSF